MQRFDNKRNSYPIRKDETLATVSPAWETVCRLTSLLIAEKRCHRRVGYKNSVSKFHMLALTRCHELRVEMLDGTYKTQLGTVFQVYYPKYREVRSTKYRDRIPQTSFILNYYYPRIIPKLVATNCACIKGRGVDMARDIAKQMLREADISGYALKADIKSFFGSIDHEVLFREMRLRFIQDQQCFDFYRDVIDCNGNRVGIDLGSEVDQLSATTLLHILDFNLKEFRYIRYADDILVLGTRDECREALRIIKDTLGKLKLRLSAGKTYIQPICRPVRWLGFTYLKHPSGRLTAKRNKDKLKAERRKLKKMWRKRIPWERIESHLNSARDILTRGTRSDLYKFDQYINSLFTEEYKNGIYS